MAIFSSPKFLQVVCVEVSAELDDLLAVDLSHLLVELPLLQLLSELVLELVPVWLPLLVAVLVPLLVVVLVPVLVPLLQSHYVVVFVPEFQTHLVHLFQVQVLGATISFMAKLSAYSTPLSCPT